MLHGFDHHRAAQQQDPARGHKPEQFLEKQFVQHGIFKFCQQFEQHSEIQLFV